MGVVFDKLGFMRKLESGGEFSRAQAELLTDAFYDAVVESVATKQDLGEVQAALRADVAALGSDLRETQSELRFDVAAVRSELREAKAELRSEIAQVKVWVAGTAVAVVSVLSAFKFVG